MPPIGAVIMIVRIHHEGRAYRIECPDHVRFRSNLPDLEDCLVIPDLEHPDDPVRHTYLLTPFVIQAAEEGKHGLRLIEVSSTQ